MMNPGIKLRLTALGVAVGLMGAAIVVVILVLQRQAGETRVRLSAMDSESFRIEDHFKDKLRYANDKMRRYGTVEDPAVWEEFLKAAQELKVWIGEQGPRLTTQSEIKILKQMDAAYEHYLQRARELH